MLWGKWIGVASLVAILSAPARADFTFGKVVTYPDDEGHGVEVSIPPNAPSITADYLSLRNSAGELRSENPRIEPVNHGITIKLNDGDEVIAAVSGRVISAGYSKSGGHWVGLGSSTIRHIVLYFHLTETYVKRGDAVERGQPIGKVGIAEHTPIPHLTMQVKERGTPRQKGRVNPHLYWVGGPGQISCFDEASQFVTDADRFLTYPVGCR